MKISLITDERVGNDKSGFLSHVDGECEFETLKEFSEVALQWHIAPGIFRDSIKKQDHLTSIEFIAYDFDCSELSSEDVYFNLIGSNINGIILGSKSYSPEREKFHVFLPTSEPVTSPELYKYITRKLSSLNGWDADGACMECARYYYKHKCLLYLFDKGDNLSIERFIKLKEYDDQEEERKRKMFANKKPEGEPIDTFKKTRYYKWLVDGKLKVDGERYNTCNRILGCMKKCGVDPVSAQSMIDEYSIYGQSHTRQSVIQRIKSFF